MKICYYADGRYVHASRWMRFFAERGHEMHLISFAEISKERESEIEDEGIKYHGHTGNFHLKKAWLTYKDIRFVKSVLRNEAIDVLHSHFLGTNVWFADRSGFHPHLITVMGGDVIGSEWKPDRSLQDKILTPRALKNADAVTAWSSSLAGRIKPFLNPNIEVSVLHGGVELNRFSPGPKPETICDRLKIPRNARVIFSSRLIRPLYNIDKLAEAAGLICGQLPETYFLIALPSTILDADYTDKIKHIFDGDAASDKVRYVPTIGHDEIAEFYRLADITVSIPSTDGTPMTVLESMACGTPTVIGNLTDYDREYFEDGVTTAMVDVNDPSSIADGILRILNDREFADRISNEARRRVEATGGYEYQMGKMEEIYRRVVAR